MDLGLKDRAILITGGSRGIGRAIARSFAREGARVCVVARGADALAKVVAELEAEGVSAMGEAADVTRAEDAARVVDAVVARFGKIDVLVNNAGGSLGTGAFGDVAADAFAAVLDLNLNAAVNMTRLALAPMRRAKHGVVVNVASICAFELCASAPYMAAKAALVALGKELATSGAKDGIRVVTVSPGSILFEGGSWDRRRTQNPAVFQQVLDQELPWKRFGTPEEIADVVTFLASSRASWVTGANVVVDGAQSRSVR